ncbi:hypothetical protein [Miltoncostaea marina]|uniref:hypothetical protein n=1 Tax=Miltoncostaea marina TaxID=2843215 RepID=UPI001C3DFD98|nr:hypothetical protein [Miltoncostaea marina]
MSRATVLVLWTGYPAGANAVHELRRAGFRVIGAHEEGRIDGRSPACPAPRRYPSPDAAPTRFLAWVADVCRAEGVDAVVPIDEDIVRLLAERGAEIGPVVIVGPTAHQYATLCDKRRLAETAAALGLPTPRTVEVDAAGPDGPWPPLPSIVKPRTSRSDVAKPRAVATAAERDAYVAELVADGHAAIVQERIVGPRWVVQSVRGAGVFEFVPLRVLREWPRGAGLAALKRADAAPAELVASAKALLDHVGYVGPSGVSFMEREGRFHPHDVNLRLGATSSASVHAGFHFQRRAVEVALGIGGVPFDGLARTGPYMRLDLEVQALVEALRRPGGERPGAVLRAVAAVALDSRGRLDPSPLNPFWAAALAGSVLRRALGRARRGAAPPSTTTRPLPQRFLEESQ